MTGQHRSRLYWKEALARLRHTIPAEETAAARNRKWASAHHQAQADLEDPGAIVWLPDEIAAVIGPGQAAPASAPAQPRHQRLKALLLALLFLVPAVISYLLAYRRISAHLR